MTFAMITHAAPGDTFWDIVRKGAEAAAAKDNVELKYSSDPDAGQPGQAHPEAIDQQGGRHRGHARQTRRRSSRRSQKAIARRHPGRGVQRRHRAPTRSRGVLSYFGSDESSPARPPASALGRRLQEVLCVIQEQGHVAAGSPLRGVKETFTARYEKLYVERHGHAVGAVDHLGAKLHQDPTHRRHHHPRRADRADRASTPSRTPAARPRSARSTSTRDPAEDPVRRAAVRRRPAAVAAGLRGRRRAVAVQAQRQHPRRRPARR